MKKILLACGSGIATSTAVNAKLTQMLEENGYAGKFKITQCKISEVPALSAEHDFCVATTMQPTEMKCPFISGISFLTGAGLDATFQEIKTQMEK
ncbi:PTS galactitol transporter subunit IIB [Clostridiales bacterium COT073_COT-073]|nr:PTS galactitol transporter subunit IIB [Clostridiales bacterium COT073_COT-073]